MALKMIQRPMQKKRRPKRGKTMLKMVNTVLALESGEGGLKGNGVVWKNILMADRSGGSRGLLKIERANHVQNKAKVVKNRPPMMVKMV
jgi:hypothetical protein